MRAFTLLCLSAALVACSNSRTVDTNADSGTPGGCKADTECAAGQVCKDAKCVDKVVPPAKKACKSSADCGEKLACRADACVVTSCINDGECEAGEQCTGGSCELKGCRADLDCDGKQRCSLATHSCVDCELSDDCPAERPVCRADGKCIDCTTNLDCAPPKAAFCNKLSGTCVSCLGDENCPTGLRCVQNACVGNKTGEACDRVKLCDKGLICVNFTGAGSLCAEKCDRYLPACALGKICQPLGDGQGGLIFEEGHPLGICSNPAPNYAKLDESCGGAVNCQFNLVCVPESAAGGRCRRLCDPKLTPSPCPLGTTCNTIEAGYSPSDVLGICYVKSDWYKSCSDDSGCGLQFGCTLATDPKAIDGYGTRCEYSPPNASKGPNTPCSKDDECRSGFCLRDKAGAGTFCYGACATDASCPNGFCGSYNFTFNNGKDTATIDGCHVKCASNTECARYGSTFCYPQIFTKGSVTTLRGDCVQAQGPGDIGATCAANTGCSALRCNLADSRGVAQAGVCTTLCEKDSDCKGGLVCPADGVAVVNGTTGFIAARLCSGAPCVSESDCTTAGLPACRVERSPLKPRDEFVLRCGTASGAGKTGATCATDANCASGLCFDPSGTGAGPKICFGACNPAATPTSCPTGTTCKTGIAELAAPSGVKQKFDACAP